MALADSHSSANGAHARVSRRRVLGALAALPLIGMGGGTARAVESTHAAPAVSRERVRALLLSATTLAGKGSLEHARAHLARLFGDRRRIVLINFASLPEDRDAYAARMYRDFKHIDERFEVESVHDLPKAKALATIRSAEGIFVSGGNTFLLLRELFDRGLVEVIHERVFSGVPYGGSSAGSNIAGTVIGTTNDFPLVDIPTRRALNILPGTFNPHHPEPSDKALFDGRQWKIGHYARYHPEECIFGVTNGGMIQIEGDELTLEGEGVLATVRLGERSARISDNTNGNVSAAIASLRRQVETHSE